MQQLTALVSSLGLCNAQMSERMASLEASRNASQELPRQSEGQLPPRPSPNDDGGDGSSGESGTGPSGNGGDGGHPSRHQGPPDGGGDSGGDGIFCDDNVHARTGRVLFGQDSKTLSPAQIKEFKSLKSLDSRIPLTDALRECTRLVIKALVESDGKSFHSQIGILTALCSVGCNLGTNVASQHATSAMLSDMVKSSHPIWQQSSAPGYSEVAVSDSGPGDDLSLLDDDGTSGGSGGKGGGSVSGSGGQNAAQQGHSFGAVVDSSKGGHGRGRSQSSERSGRGRGMLDMPVYSGCLLQLMEDGVKAYSLTDPIVAFDAAVSKCYANAISSMSAEGRSRFVLEDPRQRTVSAPNGPVLKTLMVEGAGVFDDELRLNGNASFSRLMAIKDICGFSRKNSAYSSAKSKCGNSADYCLSWWYTTSELAKYLNDQFGKFLRGRESGKAPGGPGKGKGKGSGKGGQSRGRSRHRRSGGNGGGSSGATAMVSLLDSNPAGSDGDGKQTTNADGNLDP